MPGMGNILSVYKCMFRFVSVAYRKIIFFLGVLYGSNSYDPKVTLSRLQKITLMNEFIVVKWGVVICVNLTNHNIFFLKVLMLRPALLITTTL